MVQFGVPGHNDPVGIGPALVQVFTLDVELEEGKELEELLALVMVDKELVIDDEADVVVLLPRDDVEEVRVVELEVEVDNENVVDSDNEVDKDADVDNDNAVLMADDDEEEDVVVVLVDEDVKLKPA